jgi:GNAT superfamily N-acetyltransferase
MTTVRIARLEDKDKVIALCRQLASSASRTNEHFNKSSAKGDIFHNIINDKNIGTILVAEHDGYIVGVITLSYPLAMRTNGLYACVEEFVVDEHMRGKGIGSLLLKAAITEAQFRGCYEVQVNNPSEVGYPVYLYNGIEDVGKHMSKRLAN